MTQRLDRLNVNVVNACGASLTCDSCGSCGHVIVNFCVENLFAPSDQVAYVNNFQPRLNHSPILYNNNNNSWCDLTYVGSGET